MPRQRRNAKDARAIRRIATGRARPQAQSGQDRDPVLSARPRAAGESAEAGSARCREVRRRGLDGFADTAATAFHSAPRTKRQEYADRPRRDGGARRPRRHAAAPPLPGKQILMPRQRSDETTNCLLIAGATFLILDV